MMTKILFGVACATSSIFYPNDRYKDTPSPFIYDKTKKNTKCLTYLKNHREPMPFYLPGLHSRIYKNHRHKMIRHTKLIDHILRLPSLNATLQFIRIQSFKDWDVLYKVAYLFDNFRYPPSIKWVIIFSVPN